MKRDQFLRALKGYCKVHALSFAWHPGEGKGSHGAVYVGDKRTMVPNKDLPDFYVDAILKQLGLPKGSLR